jgi:hypothetical protein
MSKSAFEPERCELCWAAIAASAARSRTDPALLSQGIRELLLLMTALSVPSFIVSDIVGNVNTLDSAARARPNETVESMCESAQLSQSRQVHLTTQAIANVLRTIEFSVAFVEHILAAPSASTSHAARLAYDATLARFHVFPLRLVVRSAILLLPTRAVFFSRIQPANNPSFNMNGSLQRFKVSASASEASLRCTLKTNNISE